VFAAAGPAWALDTATGDAIPMIKPAELRDQTDEQLELLLKDVQNNLFRLRLQSETERLEAPSEIIKAKREIARIKTILRLRQIERENAVAAPSAR
jgi:large subunit ribosomal protein L29